MAMQPQNSFSDLPLGRSIEEREVVALPSGREVVRLWREISVEAPSGTWRTVVESRLDPTLDCGCNPYSLHKIRECMLCAAIVCTQHSFDCPLCNLVACAVCGVALDMDGTPTRVCVRCAKAIHTPKLVRWIKGIFKA